MIANMCARREWSRVLWWNRVGPQTFVGRGKIDGAGVTLGIIPAF